MLGCSLPWLPIAIKPLKYTPTCNGNQEVGGIGKENTEK